MAAQLAPFNPPLGPSAPNPQFYSPSVVTLQMKEKMLSFTGDDFSIKTVDGIDVLRCEGKTFSARSKKRFTDTSGRELFTLKNKLLAMFKSFVAETSDGGLLFEVRGQFAFGSSKSSVHFENYADKSQIELGLKGDWLDRSADLTLNGRPVAHISRDFFNAREFFGGHQTYFVTVAPNVDLALVAAVCVCLDERENERK